MKTNSKRKIEVITVGAALSAIVVVLQLFASYIQIAGTPISLVLIPIVIGAALCGKYVSAWLGFVFGMTVLLSGQAAGFMTFSVVGTIVTVLLKGTACGFLAGLVYEAVAKKNKNLATLSAAVVCPVVNTGIFMLGCFTFFFNDLALAAATENSNIFVYVIVTYVTTNFLVELLVNVVLNPTIVRLIDIIRKR